MLEAECGTGKSIIPIAAAATLGFNAIVLIQTLQLQEQYMRDFYQAKMMAGRRHSICNKTNRTADRAPCTIGAKCELKGVWDRATGLPIIWPECNYFARKAESIEAQISIQNYAFWLGETKSAGTVFDSRDMIICDEAHELDQILMAAGIIELNHQDLRAARTPIALNMKQSIEEYRTWALNNISTVKSTKRQLQQRLVELGMNITLDEDTSDSDGADWDPSDPSLEVISNLQVDDLISRVHACTRVIQAMTDLEAIGEGEYAEWVFDPKPAAILLKPIYGKYGFRKLLKAARKKIVLMSAFLAPKLLMNTLGINPEDVDVIDAGKVFDRKLSQIYYCPTIKLGYKTKPNEWSYVFKIVDRFAGYYADKKGLIHVPSIKIRNEYLRATEQRHRILAYDAPNSETRFPIKEKVIDTFITSPKPQIILGQSISTGLDIPYHPQWQVIPKLWYMPLDDPAVIKRKEVDKDFYSYYTICQIVQATGRVKRAPNHDGPTIILDAQFGWFYGANKEHFPKWFRDNLVYNGWKEYEGIQRSLRGLAIQSGVIL